MKICIKCSIEKPNDSFSKDKQQKIGIRNTCKNCANIYWNEYKRTPEGSLKVKISNRKAVEKYFAKNRDKVMAVRRRYTKARELRLRFSILREKNFTCQYCGKKSPDVKLQIDHIFPKSKGGKNTKENLTVACVECNIGKSDVLL